MSSDFEVRIKLAPNIHQKWIKAASMRGLSLKGFIAATVSSELIRTGELNPATESGVTAAAPPPSTKRAASKIDHDAIAAEWPDDDED